jgi:transcriptional regulator with XRE-family HTH domain
MNRDWARLGEAIVRAYESLGLRQKEFAELAGVSPSTLYRLEKGSGPAPSDSTLAKIERALSWHAGSAAAVAEGERIPAAALPTTARVRKPAALSDPSVLDQLPTQISEELQQPGEVLGVDVVDLGPDGSGARMIVVVKRDASGPDPTPETVRATLEEWQRKRRELWRRQGESNS